MLVPIVYCFFYCIRFNILVGTVSLVLSVVLLFFFQAEDGIRDLVRSRGLGDVYKRQVMKRLRI